MWCPKCQADVSATASADNQRLTCTACGSELGRALPAEGSPVRRSPRELLARWAEEDAQEPFGIPLTARSPGGSTSATESEAGRRAESRTAAHADADPDGLPSLPGSALPGVSRLPGYAHERAREPHEAHMSPEPIPASRPRYVPVSRYQTRGRGEPGEPDYSSRRNAPSGSHWMQTAGQLFSYLGVATLFISSVLVRVRYFGDLPGYAPTGWLVTTAGQMLLFLGVITLLSGGMEGLQEQFATSLDELHERLDRMERGWMHDSAPTDEQPAELPERPRRSVDRSGRSRAA